MKINAACLLAAVVSVQLLGAVTADPAPMAAVPPKPPAQPAVAQPAPGVVAPKPPAQPAVAQPAPAVIAPKPAAAAPAAAVVAPKPAAIQPGAVVTPTVQPSPPAAADQEAGLPGAMDRLRERLQSLFG